MLLTKAPARSFRYAGAVIAGWAILSLAGSVRAGDNSPKPIVMSDGLKREEIGGVIKNHWNEIKHCYEDGLTRNGALAGKITAFWVISPTGAVDDVRIQNSTLADQHVQDCMTSAIREWQFPAPKGGGNVNVTYPWVFLPAKTK